LGTLENLHLLLKGRSPNSAPASTITWTIDAVPQQLRPDGFGATKTHDAEPNVGASFHQVIDGNI
jgi:hypothetical protein